MAARSGSVQRRTRETNVSVALAVDGSGRADIRTGIGMLDHLLEQLAHHGLLDLTVTAEGDLERDPHHMVEDVAIALGHALDQALGQRLGIVRMGHAIVPLDEALALVAVDLSGRGFAAVAAEFTGPRLGQLPTQLIAHFLSTFAVAGRLNLHARLLAGHDDHHRAEAIFKALARSLAMAVQLDVRRRGQVPSTKGTLEA
ncbi:MAG: imidazoleglycerol-phosphate dehydratase HisB [Dehalococcoidia bacterium]